MWSPKTSAELIQAIDEDTLPHEAAAFEVKTKLPERSKNSDIAVDVAAMATDGGIIIYGVLENKEKATFMATPISLVGVKDRISEIISSNIREEVSFDVRLLPLEGDPSTGFVVVEVPASVRAPHMVEVRGEHRFYGRVPGGNRPLTESRIAALYERRALADTAARRALDEAVAHAPIEPGDRRGDLFVVVRPLLSDSGVRERALGDNEFQAMLTAVKTAASAIRFAQPWQPHLGDLMSNCTDRTTLDGFMLWSPPFGAGISHYVSSAELLDDGTLRFFRADLLDDTNQDGLAHRTVRDTAAAQLIAQVSWLAGHLLEAGSYSGEVDVSVLITELEGAASAQWFMGRGMFFPHASLPSIDAEEYRDTTRVRSSELKEKSCVIAEQLLRRLSRVIRVDSFPNPLETQDG
jgi:hypothetical protein